MGPGQPVIAAPAVRCENGGMPQHAVPPAPPLRENAADKAYRYVTSGRLTIVRVVPGEVVAWCKGDGAVHQLGWSRGGYWCSCESRSAHCSHLRALRLVVAPDL